ncbi:MAG TPA: CoA pyrophosphatase [bacterium]|nr:CoA pyrophosphatase [bacterium]
MTLARLIEALSPMPELPGDAARDAMVPPYRRNSAHDVSDAPWREAAVLVLFYQDADDVRFPLIVRTDNGSIHGGQISLPGGSREADETPEACALRETDEELGVGRDDMRVLGALSPLRVPPSRFIVRPFLGCATRMPQFKPSPVEVSSLLLPSLAELLDSPRRGIEEISYGGRTWPVPCYHLSGGIVWGATAMILAELEAILSGTLA